MVRTRKVWCCRSAIVYHLLVDAAGDRESPQLEAANFDHVAKAFCNMSRNGFMQQMKRETWCSAEAEKPSGKLEGKSG